MQSVKKKTIIYIRYIVVNILFQLILFLPWILKHTLRYQKQRQNKINWNKKKLTALHTMFINFQQDA